MATTVTLESETVDEIMALTGARTKTEAVREALAEYVRLRRRQQLLSLEGRIRLRLTNEQVEKLERE